MQYSVTGPYGLPIVGHTCVFQRAHSVLPKPLNYRSGRTLQHSKAPALDVAAKAQTDQQQANPGEPIESPTVNPIAKHQEGGKNDAEDQLYRGELTFREPTYAQRYWTSFRLFFALPWRRFKSESVLAIEISGSIGDKRTGRFGDAFSLPQVCEALIKAAYDPRIKGLYLKIGPVGAGWAKLKEVRDHLRLFRESGKFMIAFSTIAGEKEYYLASACSEIYMPPTGRLQLAGFSLSGTFLKGVLEKLGIDPEVRRIGTFKSAGDQLLRKDMSDSQREQLTAILEDVTLGFKQTIAEARGKSVEEVQALLDEGVFDNERYKEGGWVTDLWYEDQVLQALKERTGGKPDIIRGVPLRKYAWVSLRAFGFERGSKAIAVIRTSGIIVGGDGAPSDSVISASPFIKMLRQAAKTKAIAGVVLRVDSGGGDALASDLMWREVQKLAEKKPVVASMGDVAGSGGYYLAMGAHSIVAQPLTITGSIGVVAATFKLQEVYRRAGYTKTVISRGRYAEQGNESRPFTDDESDLFDRATDFAYASFRDRAASSRGMSIEAMQEVAQGRVWTGRAAISRGLVDALGGVATAVELVKERVRLAAGDQDLKLRTVEVSRAKGSPLALLTGGGGALAQCSALLQIIWMAATQGSSIQQILLAAAQSGTQSPQLLEQLNLLQSRQPVALMPEIQIDGCGSSSIASSQSSLQSQGGLLLDEGIDKLL